MVFCSSLLFYLERSGPWVPSIWCDSIGNPMDQLNSSSLRSFQLVHLQVSFLLFSEASMLIVTAYSQTQSFSLAAPSVNLVSMWRSRMKLLTTIFVHPESLTKFLASRWKSRTWTRLCCRDTNLLRSWCTTFSYLTPFRNLIYLATFLLPPRPSIFSHAPVRKPFDISSAACTISACD